MSRSRNHGCRRMVDEVSRRKRKNRRKKRKRETREGVGLETMATEEWWMRSRRSSIRRGRWKKINFLMSCQPYLSTIGNFI
jgi:hypothetical protein